MRKTFTLKYLDMTILKQTPMNKDHLYTSHSLNSYRIKKRLEPVWWGKETNRPWVAEYIKNGCIVFSSLLEEKFRCFNVADCLHKIKNLRAPGSIIESQSHELRSQFNIHHSYPQLIHQLLHEDLISISRDILGGEPIIYQSHVNFKQARVGEAYGWHSDYVYWHHHDGMVSPQAISIVIPLAPHNKENGGLEILKGSHLYYYETELDQKGQWQEDQIRHGESQSYSDRGLVSATSLKLFSSNQYRSLSLRAGDIFIMDANLWHWSPSNTSEIDRPTLFLILISSDTPFKAINQPYRPSYISCRKGIKLMSFYRKSEDKEDKMASPPLKQWCAFIPQISEEDAPLVHAASRLGLRLSAYSVLDSVSKRKKLREIFSSLPIYRFPSRYQLKKNSLDWQWILVKQMMKWRRKNEFDFYLRASRFNELLFLPLLLIRLFPKMKKNLPLRPLHWDKEKYYRKLKAHAVSVPKVYQVIKDDEEIIFHSQKQNPFIRFPCICKPSDGTGGAGIFVARSWADLDLFFGTEPNPKNFDERSLFYRSRNKRGLRYYLYHSGEVGGNYLIQEYIPGRIFSLSGATINCCPVSSFCYEIGVTNNSFCAEQEFSWPIEEKIEKALLDLAGRTLQILKYPDGPFMIDFIYREESSSKFCEDNKKNNIDQIYVIDSSPRASSTGVQLCEWVFENELHAQDLITSHLGFLLAKNFSNLSDLSYPSSKNISLKRRYKGRPIFWKRFPFPKGKVKKMKYPQIDREKWIVAKNLCVQPEDSLYEMRLDRQMAQRGFLVTTGNNLNQARANWEKYFSLIDWKIE